MGQGFSTLRPAVCCCSPGTTQAAAPAPAAHVAGSTPRRCMRAASVHGAMSATLRGTVQAPAPACTATGEGGWGVCLTAVGLTHVVRELPWRDSTGSRKCRPAVAHLRHWRLERSYSVSLHQIHSSMLLHFVDPMCMPPFLAVGANVGATPGSFAQVGCGKAAVLLTAAHALVCSHKPLIGYQQCFTVPPWQ